MVAKRREGRESVHVLGEEVDDHRGVGGAAVEVEDGEGNDKFLADAAGEHKVEVEAGLFDGGHVGDAGGGGGDGAEERRCCFRDGDEGSAVPAEAEALPGVAGGEGGVEGDGDVAQGLLAQGKRHAEKVKGAVLVLEGVTRVVGVGGRCRRDDHGVEIGDDGDELGGEEGFREDGEEGGQPREDDTLEGREIRGVGELGDVVGADVGEAGGDLEVHRRESGELGRAVLLADGGRCLLRWRSCCR